MSETLASGSPASGSTSGWSQKRKLSTPLSLSATAKKLLWSRPSTRATRQTLPFQSTAPGARDRIHAQPLGEPRIAAPVEVVAPEQRRVGRRQHRVLPALEDAALVAELAVLELDEIRVLLDAAAQRLLEVERHRSQPTARREPLSTERKPPPAHGRRLPPCDAASGWKSTWDRMRHATGSATSPLIMKPGFNIYAKGRAQARRTILKRWKSQIAAPRRA